MKNVTLIALLAFILFGLGCSKKAVDEILEKAKADAEQNKAKQADIMSSINAGGQPATIKLSGHGLKNGALLNSQAYSVGSFGGRKCKSEQDEAVSPKRVASLSKIEDDKPLNQKFEKTYLNIGCGKNINKKTIAGFTYLKITELKKLAANKKVWSVKAGKIFVCSTIDLSNMTSVDLSADEVYFANAVLTTSDKMTTSLKLTTNKLILEGSSSFSSLIKDETMPSLVSPFTEVSLTVAQETLGTGTLAITAKGANCIESEKK